MKKYRFNRELDHKRGKFVVKTENESFEETFLKAFTRLNKEDIEIFPDGDGVNFTTEVTCADGLKKPFRSFMVGELTEPKGVLYQFDEIS
ncbi:hypothetical protein [Paenimyroides ceti]